MHYSIFLFFLSMCFCISCVNNNLIKIGKTTIKHQKNIWELPISNFHIKINNKSIIATKKIKNHINKYLKLHYPNFKIASKNKSNIVLLINIGSSKEKIVERENTLIRFKDGWAHFPIEKNITINSKHLIFPISITLIDNEINYIIYKKETKFITSYENSENEFYKIWEKFLRPTKHQDLIPWINGKGNNLKQDLASNNLDHVLEALTRLINNEIDLLNKKKQISLKHAYDLAILYHNRASILKYLGKYAIAKKDQKKAQSIFSFIGNHHVK